MLRNTHIKRKCKHASPVVGTDGCRGARLSSMVILIIEESSIWWFEQGLAHRGIVLRLRGWSDIFCVLEDFNDVIVVQGKMPFLSNSLLLQRVIHICRKIKGFDCTWTAWKYEILRRKTECQWIKAIEQGRNKERKQISANQLDTLLLYG